MPCQKFHLSQCCKIKTNKILNDMAKVQIKSEKPTPFGGFFSIMEQFDALLAPTIDSTLGLRCTMFCYQYSEILRSLMCAYLCGGSCIEDVTTHMMKHLSLHPTLRTCSAEDVYKRQTDATLHALVFLHMKPLVGDEHLLKESAHNLGEEPGDRTFNSTFIL